jgi:hypothetical protein
MGEGIDPKILRKAYIANFFATWISFLLLIGFNVIDRYVYDFGLSSFWNGAINFTLFFIAFFGIRQVVIFIEGTRKGSLGMNTVAYIRLIFLVLAFGSGVYFFFAVEEISGIGIFFAAFYVMVASDVYLGYLKEDSDSWAIFIIGLPWTIIYSALLEKISFFRKKGPRYSIYLVCLLLSTLLVYAIGFWIEGFIRWTGFPWG